MAGFMTVGVTDYIAFGSYLGPHITSAGGIAAFGLVFSLRGARYYVHHHIVLPAATIFISVFLINAIWG